VIGVRVHRHQPQPLGHVKAPCTSKHCTSPCTSKLPAPHRGRPPPPCHDGPDHCCPRHRHNRQDHVTQTSVPTFPPGGSGRRRGPGARRRWLPYVLVVPVVAGAVWLAVVLYGKYGTNDYQATLESYGSISDTKVTMRFSVHKAGGGPAVCRVHAQ